MADQVIASPSKARLIHSEAAEPATRHAIRSYGHRRDSIDGIQFLAVVSKHRASSCDSRVQYLELGAADRGQNVAHAVVVAKLGMIVGQTRIPSLSRQVSNPRSPIRPSARNHSTAGG